MEIRAPARCTEFPLDKEANDEALREELDLVDDIRAAAALREARLKQQITFLHDTKVIKREFKVGSLVLRRNQKESREGKLQNGHKGRII